MPNQMAFKIKKEKGGEVNFKGVYLIPGSGSDGRWCLLGRHIRPPHHTDSSPFTSQRRLHATPEKVTSPDNNYNLSWDQEESQTAPRRKARAWVFAQDKPSRDLREILLTGLRWQAWWRSRVMVASPILLLSKFSLYFLHLTTEMKPILDVI